MNKIIKDLVNETKQYGIKFNSKDYYKLLECHPNTDWDKEIIQALENAIKSAKND